MYALPIGTRPLANDEVAILRQSQAVVHGESGLRMFFQSSAERWLPPVAVYATALTSVVAPSEHAGRLAAAAAGALNVALMFVLSRRLFPGHAAPIAAALLLMATPAHFVFARTGIDAIYGLPFALTWLIGLIDYLRTGERWRLALGALALGVGIYAQPSGPLTMGLFLAVTLAVMWVSGRRDGGSLAVPVLAFSGPVAASAIWFAANPQAYPDTFGRWAVHAAHLRFPLDGIRAFVNWNTLGTRVSLYWGFFDPSWLFLDGPATPGSALQGGAPFLFATVLLLVAGITWRLRTGPAAFTVLLFASLAVAPLAASTFGEPHAIASALVVTPLVVLLAAGGLASWFAKEHRGWRVVRRVTMAALAVDFARFYASQWPG